MGFMNTEEQYGLGAKFFHWTIAVLILGLLPVGLFMGGMENSPVKFQIYAMHKSFGLLVFFLGLGRIVWHLVNPPPDHLETHTHWETVLAGAAHFWLYICIIGMPLTGWLMSSANEFPVPFFGIQMPAIIGKDPAIAGIFGQAHEILAYTLLFILALHIAGALKHHVLDKDITLERMAFYKKGLLLPVLVVLVAGTSYAVSGLSILSGGKEKPEKTLETSQPAIAATTAPDVPAASSPALAANAWAIVPAQSKLTFQAVLYKAPFTATFGDFDGEIILNPEDLTTAKADIRIAMDDITSGDVSRDDNMKGVEWLDATAFPESRFVSTKFEKGEGNNYVAIGDITIHGVTMPLIIPFQLEIAAGKAHMTAKFSLDRSHFGVGTGQWADESAVAYNIDVSIDLTAVQ